MNRDSPLYAFFQTFLEANPGLRNLLETTVRERHPKIHALVRWDGAWEDAVADLLEHLTAQQAIVLLALGETPAPQAAEEALVPPPHPGPPPPEPRPAPGPPPPLAGPAQSLSRGERAGREAEMSRSLFDPQRGDETEQLDLMLEPAPEVHPGAAPPPRTLNAALFTEAGDRQSQQEALPLGQRRMLRLNIGPVATWSAVSTAALFPEDISQAIANAGGEDLVIAVQSPHFEIEEVEPGSDGRWATVERILFVPARGESHPLELSVRPLRGGPCYLRATVYYRNFLVQSLRLDAQVGDALPNGLSYSAVIEYTASLGMAGLSALPGRAVTLSTNAVDGTHALSVRVDGQDTAAQTVTLRPDQMGLRAQAARSALDAACTQVNGDKKTYRYSADANAGTPATLIEVFKRMARVGYQLYGELLPTDLRAALTTALRKPTTISVARLAEGEVLPWAMLYDRPIEIDPALPLDVCLKLLDVPSDQPLDCEACRARPECPLNDPLKKRSVVCPWGFWGIKHAIEQPPQRLDPGQEGRALVTEISGTVRLDMNVYPNFSRLVTHRPRIAALADTFVYAGDDLAPGAPTALSSVRTALHDPELTAIYFFCHGGEVVLEGLPAPFLAIGKGRDRVFPVELREVDADTGAAEYAWPHHPLVFLNGCETASLEPRVLAHFVDAFAERGASGVIGTEISVFEVLAVEVAETFLRLFFAEGRTVGEALREVRHALLRKNNPLGLAYTAYSSADLRFVRA